MMTLSIVDLWWYGFALVVLFMTPGPVWVAVMARALSGGFRSAWPLAFGVALGDALWPLVAVLGVSWIAGEYEGLIEIMRWVAVVFFALMGGALLRSKKDSISADSRLTRPGMLAGFLAGVAVILGNPKAILFYMGMLPGFFDLTAVTRADIAAIVALSMVVPFVGNLFFAAIIGRLRGALTSPRAINRMNRTAGILLLLVALVIAFST